MSTDKRRKDFDKPVVDEELIMNIMSGNQSFTVPEVNQKQEIQKETKPKEKARNSSSKKVDSPADRDIYAIVRFRLATLKRCICKKTRNAVAIA